MNPLLQRVVDHSLNPQRERTNEVHDLIVNGELFQESEARFSEGRTANGVPYRDVPARLFSVGVHNGRSYTLADLQELASTFQAPKTDLEDWDVPIQLDHSSSARDTIGHVRSVSVRGSDLMGILRFVGEDAIKPVREGRYRKLSVGIRLTKPKRLKEVSATPFPALTNAALAASFNEKGNTMSLETKLDTIQTICDRKKAELAESLFSEDRYAEARLNGQADTFGREYEKALDAMDAVQTELVQQAFAQESEEQFSDRWLRESGQGK